VPPGTYKLVVKAGDQLLTAEGVQVALGKEATVRIVIRNDQLAFGKQ
jgi:hypothetical protein